MRRRGFLRLVAGAIVAASVPVGSLFEPSHKWHTVRWVYRTDEMPLDDFVSLYVEPAARALAEDIDRQIIEIFTRDVVPTIRQERIV